MNLSPFADQKSFANVNEVLQPITQEVFIFNTHDFSAFYGKNPTQTSDTSPVEKNGNGVVIERVRLKEEIYKERTLLEEEIKVEHVDFKQESFRASNEDIENKMVGKGYQCLIEVSKENEKIVIKCESDTSDINHVNIHGESQIDMLQNRQNNVKDAIEEFKENEQLQHVKEELTVEYGGFDKNDIVKTEIVEGTKKRKNADSRVDIVSNLWPYVLLDRMEVLEYFKNKHRKIAKEVGITDEKQTKFECRICKMQFSSKHYLEAQHMTIHTSEESSKCELCEKIFSNKCTLKTHKLYVHTEERPYECHTCSIRVKNKGTLIRHLRTHTNSGQTYTCELCNKHFTRRSSLRRHIRIHIAECDLCPTQSYYTEKDLKQHVAIHIVKIPLVKPKLENASVDVRKKEQKNILIRKEYFKNINLTNASIRVPKACDSDDTKQVILESQFSSKSNVEKPMKRKSSKCEVCKMTFSKMYHLKRHMMIHTGEKPFECEQCESKFSNNACLKRHMMIHTGERPEKCEVCEKRFPEKNALRRHMTKHTQERRYECHICLLRYKEKGTLVRHLQTHSQL